MITLPSFETENKNTLGLFSATSTCCKISHCPRQILCDTTHASGEYLGGRNLSDAGLQAFGRTSTLLPSPLVGRRYEVKIKRFFVSVNDSSLISRRHEVKVQKKQFH